MATAAAQHALPLQAVPLPPPSDVRAAPAVSVIVPTFREAPNLPELVDRIAAALAGAGLSGEIIIVDDDSRDGTQETADRLAARYPVQLVVRKAERGLSSAVLCGFESARGATLVVMDADLSHPPEAIPELVRIIVEGRGDFALGSRYVPGGRTEDWTPARWLNSKAATLLARPVTSCRDPMSGFFAIAASRVRRAAELRPLGYKIGLELMVKCGCRRVVEIPIVFRNRRHGESKLTIRQQFLFVRHIFQLAVFRLFGRRPPE
ncbi:MAG: polyprenol monophosphomannose synthase [Planctomycetes bacterium]|nr:polyprenol monophosphomannose synthase [Planctomycetota bacterium]